MVAAELFLGVSVRRPHRHKRKRILQGEETSELWGLAGREASEAPAYTQDFARLEIECER